MTAGFAVVVISLHYVDVYDPTCDPFQKDGQTPPTPFRPNPIDEGVLTTLNTLLMRVPFVKISSKKLANPLLKVGKF